LLGEYLLKDLLLARRNVAVLCRNAPGIRASDRIEDLLARWENSLDFALPRPIVIEADITQPRAAISDSDIDWIRKHCDSFLHNAASLTFDSNREDGEPWRSNLLGTQHAIDVCKLCGINTIFHVSTAYVCGRRTGIIRENELDCGQSFATEYEASKCASELAWREADFENLTVLRPAIIVGDSDTGYTSTYHGFYAPLKSLSALLSQIGRKSGSGEKVPVAPMLNALGLSGSETKNFVPVNWVSRLISLIALQPMAWNRVYHLTPEHRVNALDVAVAMQNSLERFFARQTQKASAGSDRLNQQDLAQQHRDNHSHQSPSETGSQWNALGNAFAEQVSAYQEYWRDDPVFDATHRRNFSTSLPTLDLECPVLDRELLEKFCDFALDHGFGWPKRRIGLVPYRFTEWLTDRDIMPGCISRPAVQLNALSTGGMSVTLGYSDQGSLVQERGCSNNLPSLTFGFRQLLEAGSFANLDEAGLLTLQLPPGELVSLEEFGRIVQTVLDSIDEKVVTGVREKVAALT